MRNKRNEVTDFNEIVGIIKRCDTIRIAFFDEEYPYIVPFNYGEEVIDGKVIIYIHTGYKGKKIDLMVKDPKVGFEMNGNHELYYREANGSCNFRYESVVGQGILEVVEEDQKAHALTVLMNHYHDESVKFNPKFMPATNCLKLTVTSLTAKHVDSKGHTPDYKVMPFAGATSPHDEL